MPIFVATTKNVVLGKTTHKAENQIKKHTKHISKTTTNEQIHIRKKHKTNKFYE